MFSLFRKDTDADSLRETIQALVDTEPDLADELAAAEAHLGEVALVTLLEDDPQLVAARQRLALARQRCEENAAALRSARTSALAAQARENAKETKRLARAAEKADAEHIAAAHGFDAAVAMLGAAFADYLAAREAADTARRAAGLAPVPRNPGMAVLSALMHTAPELVQALRGPMANPVLATRLRAHSLATRAGAPPAD